MKSKIFFSGLCIFQSSFQKTQNTHIFRRVEVGTVPAMQNNNHDVWREACGSVPCDMHVLEVNYEMKMTQIHNRMFAHDSYKTNEYADEAALCRGAAESDEKRERYVHIYIYIYIYVNIRTYISGYIHTHALIYTDLQILYIRTLYGIWRMIHKINTWTSKNMIHVKKYTLQMIYYTCWMTIMYIHI